MDNYVWLKNTRQRWKVGFEVWLGLFGAFAVLIGIVFLVVSFFAGVKVLVHGVGAAVAFALR